MLSTTGQAAALQEVLPMTSCNDRLLGSLFRATTGRGHQLHWAQAAWKGTVQENFSHPSTIPVPPCLCQLSWLLGNADGDRQMTKT